MQRLPAITLTLAVLTLTFSLALLAASVFILTHLQLSEVALPLSQVGHP